MRPIEPDTELVERVRSIVARTSIAAAARQLGFAEATVARIAGGLRVTPGTALLAQRKLDELANAA